MAINNSNVTSAGSAIYTSSGNTVVSTVHLCNQSATTILVSLNLVPSGGSASASNLIYKNISISSSDTYVIENERLILGNGDFIFANANVTNSVISTITFTGI